MRTGHRVQRLCRQGFLLLSLQRRRRSSTSRKGSRRRSRREAIRVRRGVQGPRIPPPGLAIVPIRAQDFDTLWRSMGLGSRPNMMSGHGSDGTCSLMPGITCTGRPAVMGMFQISACTGQRLGYEAAIHALTERWWDTTHTFNLPCGEFTLSPLHFSAITGLRVGGQRIPFDLSLRERPEEVVRLLGFLPSGYANGRAPYDQLRKGATYRPCETEEQIDQYTRCFLLYMIGMSIFTINHDRTADMCFLSPLRDVDNISRFDWGGAALSTLYANLDGFSRGVRRGFGGLYRVLEKKNALLHLQIWAYELRLIKAPKVNPSDDDEAVGEYSTELPAGRRWIGKRFSAESSPKIHPHRLRLDSLEFHMINTNP
ncbi:protein MAINTENANCE OF MERISTEMS-like isoform X6 [Punica granatum]|uniref:Protein MAINTENANCE OF MERISTEMS-like isoform X6 n=1 Tax=Punica granatum TaxID=22663 RepID=A0A6P8CSF6_PUNGR|nr:protein MAINTENANCE OF MERISTEMS-like isoform X6 [Punica granatum]